MLGEGIRTEVLHSWRGNKNGGSPFLEREFAKGTFFY